MHHLFPKRNSVVREDLFNSVDELDLDEVKCGIGSFTPKWLQWFARKEAYLVVFCVSAIVMGAGSSYSIATVSTIEKRFHLTSNEAGIILASNDISQVFLTVILSYYGNYGNRPKMMAISFFASAIFCFMSASPHFIFGYESEGDYITSENTTNSEMDLCKEDFQSTCHDEENFSNHNLAALIILFMGQFFFGGASTAFSAIGFVYLDDNVKKGDSPLYYAISLLLKLVGPVTGFLLGSTFLSMYINIFEETTLSSTDPQWIGAWWLGYFSLGVLLVLCGMVLAVFPITLPECLKTRLHEVQLKHLEENEGYHEVDVHVYMKSLKEKQRHVKPSMKNMVSALKRLFTNKVWTGYMFHMVVSVMGVMASGAFEPKYCEDQFKISASESTFAMGVSGFVASIIGFGTSGILIKKFKPGPRVLVAIGLILGVSTSIGGSLLYFVECPDLPQVIGPTYWQESMGVCNTACNCDNKYAPVCDIAFSQTFYSACYAGCQQADVSVTPPIYRDCLCVPSPQKNTTYITDPEPFDINDPTIYGLGTGQVTFGACEIDCRPYFYLYTVLKIFRNILATSGLVGRFFVGLRSLETHDKGIALGLNTALMSLFAFIPVPIVMGKIIDTSCLVWDNTCGKSGNCWMYDSDLFRLLFILVPSGVSLISALGDIVMFKYCRNISLYSDNDGIPSAQI